ncbi:hypothetical protein FRC04_004179 [Tulasnella sp. 424]|nr:hypothetical protein FRC04_004179 [Tulasnella sp. 424]
MTSPFAHSFQLSTEDLLAIVDFIQSPLEILELSLVSKRFTEVTRTEWTWKRHLKLSGWHPDTILRHSQAEAPEGVWIKLARAACIRWQVLRPGYDRIPLGSDSMFFEDTEAIGRFLTSSLSTLFNDAWLDHQRLVIASRYIHLLQKMGQPAHLPEVVEIIYSLAGLCEYLSANGRPVNPLAEFVQRNVNDFRALTPINAAITHFIHFMRRLTLTGEVKAVFDSEMNVVYPQRSVPDAAWIPKYRGERLPWIKPLEQSWWLPGNGQDEMKLEGHSAWYSERPRQSPVFLPPMRINILRGTQSNEFTGEGKDFDGPFEIEGDTDGLVVTFVKSYHEGERWQYSGILLP